MIMLSVQQQVIRAITLALLIISARASLNGGGALHPMALYQFTYDHCHKHDFPNQAASASSGTTTSSLPPFRRNDKTTMCSRGLGVQPTTSMGNTFDNSSSINMLSTSANNEELLRLLRKDNKGLSLELWIKPLGNISKTDTATLFPIFVIGTNRTASTGMMQETLCDSQNLDLHLGQRNHILELTYRNSDTIFLPCQRYSLISFPLTQDRITHVVITMSEATGQQVYINGQGSAILRDPFRNTFPNWSEHYNMHFFSHWQRQLQGGAPSLSSGVWQGQIYQLAMYSGALNEQQVQQQIAAGLPLSAPFAVSRTVVVNEDAELVPGSHDAAWYNNTSPGRQHQDLISGHMQLIPLGFGSVNMEVEELAHSYKTQPNAQATIAHPAQSSSFFYITRLPSRGQLYQLSDANYVPLLWKNSTTPFDAVMIYSNASVLFLPLAHEYSTPPTQVYATFDYCVTATEIIDSRQCESATISVVVKPVNDPPIPLVFPSSWVTVAEGVRGDGDWIESWFSTQPRPVIQLSGKDVDHNSSIIRIRITQPPRWGHLVLSVSSFRQDRLLDGIDIKSFNYSFAAPGLVEYVYDNSNNSSKVVKGESSIVDSFQFQVADEHQMWSIPKTVSIEVVSAVKNIPQEEIIILENAGSSIRLTGNDTSGWRRPIGFFIESTPEMGKLVDPATGQVIRGGTILSARVAFPYSMGIKIHFSPSNHVCLDPKSPTTFHFSYRVVAFRADGRMASVSKSSTQSLRVQCIIHPVELELAYTITQFETVANDEHISTDFCSGYLYNASLTPPWNCSSAAIVEGINVITQDVMDLQRALVSVSSQTGYGRITLNRNYWSLLDLIEGREEMSSNISFWAYPRDLENILSFLHYQSDRAEPDHITIYIAYGNNCTNLNVRGTGQNAAMGNTTAANSFPQCQIQTRSILVTVKQARHAPGQYLIQGFPWYILPILFGFAGLIKVKLTIMAIIKTAINRHLRDRRQNRQGQEALWIERVDPKSGKMFYEDRETGQVSLFLPTFGSSSSVAKQDTDHHADSSELMTLSASKGHELR